jgi:hypothetical protein
MRMVPLLRAEGGEKEPQVGLMATEDGRPTEAEARILPLLVLPLDHL